MKIKWEAVAWEEYVNWQTNKAMLKRINLLIKDMQRTPFEGLGKPEPLKHELSGYWSRRIDEANRIVYRVEDDLIGIYQCGKHYGQH